MSRCGRKISLRTSLIVAAEISRPRRKSAEAPVKVYKQSKIKWDLSFHHLSCANTTLSIFPSLRPQLLPIAARKSIKSQQQRFSGSVASFVKNARVGSEFAATGTSSGSWSNGRSRQLAALWNELLSKGALTNGHNYTNRNDVWELINISSNLPLQNILMIAVKYVCVDLSG